MNKLFLIFCLAFSASNISFAQTSSSETSNDKITVELNEEEIYAAMALFERVQVPMSKFEDCMKSMVTITMVVKGVNPARWTVGTTDGHNELLKSEEAEKMVALFNRLGVKSVLNGITLTSQVDIGARSCNGGLAHWTVTY